MRRAMFAAPSVIFALVLAWAAGAITVLWSFDPKVLEPSQSDSDLASQFAERAGFSPLAKSMGPELRVYVDLYNYFDDKPGALLFVIDPDSASAYRAAIGENLERFAIRAAGTAPASYASTLLASIDELASYDGKAFTCEAMHTSSYLIEGVARGRAFAIRTNGICPAEFLSEDQPVMPASVVELLTRLNAVDI
jgi:hypothetical protein